MIEAFYQKMAIPETCYLGKRIYKKHFYENASLSTADQKAFTDDIDDIQWLYTLKPETIHIPRYQDDEREYQEIAIIQVNLKNRNNYKRIAQVIHRAIPYPLLLVFADESNFALSITDKRINKADREKITVAAFYESDWIDLDNKTDTQQAFLDSCLITCFSYQNLYEFYCDLTERIIALNCAYISGKYSIDDTKTKDQRIQLLTQIQQTQKQLAVLRTAMKNESQFNKKVQLNMQIKKLAEDLEHSKKQI